MSPAGSIDDLLVPAGTRVLHIGPPKTGTTALQGAFWAARDTLPAQGVRYPGTSRHTVRPMFAVTGRKPPGASVPPRIGEWKAFVADINRDPQARIMISSEGFSYASDAAIRRVVNDLDRERLHVVVTLRPLGRMLASEWQQKAQGGLRLPFDDWLDILFNHPDDRVARGFWHRQRHDRLIERWGSAVGMDRLSAVVVDERDHDRLFRVFEALLGLRSGTLVPDGSLANRSLTREEIAAMQALAARFEAEGLTSAAFERAARTHLAPYLKRRTPDPGEARIETPQWALDRAGEVARDVVAGIAASGARVIGDLEILTVVPRSRLDGDRLPEVRVSPEIAAWMAMGAVLAGNLADPRVTDSGGARPVASLSSLQLARVLAARARRSVGRRIRRRG